VARLEAPRIDYLIEGMGTPAGHLCPESMILSQPLFFNGCNEMLQVHCRWPFVSIRVHHEEHLQEITCSLTELCQSAMEQDVLILISIRGIGNKAAANVLIEMK